MNGDKLFYLKPPKCQVILLLLLQNNLIYLDKHKVTMAETVKNLPAMQETHVQSLDPKHSLEKGMCTQSNILAWRIPWIEEPGRL